MLCQVLFTFLNSRGQPVKELTYKDVDRQTKNLASFIRNDSGFGLRCFVSVWCGWQCHIVGCLSRCPLSDWDLHKEQPSCLCTHHPLTSLWRTWHAYAPVWWPCPPTHLVRAAVPRCNANHANRSLTCMCTRLTAVTCPVQPPDPRKLRKNIRMFAAVQSSCGATVALTSAQYSALKNAATMKEKLKSLFRGNSVQWPELKWVVTDSLFDGPATDSGVELDTAAPTDLAFLQYTSGSTSVPKGVMVTHSNLAHNLTSIIRALHADTSAVVVSWLPAFHDMGLIGSHLGPLFVMCDSFGFAWSHSDSPLTTLLYVTYFAGTAVVVL